jgi:hypothetical protein
MTTPTEWEAVFDTIDEWDCDPDRTMSELADRIIAEHIKPLHGRLAAIVHAAGGMVEGAPTQSINVLQRIRALVAAEALLAECETVLGEYTTDFERDMDSVHRADALLAKLKARKAEGGDA